MTDLFNPKTIKRFCDNVKIEKTQTEGADEWLRLLKIGKLEAEKTNYPDFIKIILQDILNYKSNNIVFENNNIEFQLVTKNENEDIEDKYVLLEVKNSKTDLFKDKKNGITAIEQMWKYMGDIITPYCICSNYREFYLYTREYGITRNYKFDFESIRSDKNKLKEFIGVFSKKSIIDDGFINKIHQESIKEEKDFTDEFYKLFHETRLMLIKEFQINGLGKNKSLKYAQILLNRLLFIFFTEDHNFIPIKNFFHEGIINDLKSYHIKQKSKIIYKSIIEIFKIFNEGDNDLKIFAFNGGLFSDEFPPEVFFTDFHDSDFFVDIKQHSKLHESHNEETSKIINKLPKLNQIISNILLMNSFDFKTEVSVNILGHIFEHSISDLEELENSQISKRKKDGVYYTPEYITDYICKHTIIPYLSKSSTTKTHELVNEYIENDEINILENKIKNIKILDPACGSGAFLVKAVDIVLEISKLIYEHKEQSGHYITNNQEQLTKWSDETKIRNILENNIYGVDVNQQSVEITKLSMFFKTASENKKLPNISKNIKIGNSLINTQFNWHTEFKDIFDSNNPGFDIIIGNPPYVRQEDIEEKELMQLSENCITYMKKGIPGRTDLSAYFYYFFLPRLKNNGMLGFITNDSWVNVEYGKKLRQTILKICDIKELIRTKFLVFDDADIKTITTILCKQTNLSNSVKLFNIKNIKEFFKQEIKYIKKQQHEFANTNWNLYFSNDELNTKQNLQFYNNDIKPKIDMIKMKDMGKVKPGVKTGYNKFFVINENIIKKYNIDKKYIVPVIAKNIKSTELKGVTPTQYLLNVTDSKGELQKTVYGQYVLKYIIDAENELIIPIKGNDKTPRNIFDLPSIKSHKPWWYSLSLNTTSPILLQRFVDKQIKIYENNSMFYVKNNFVEFRPDNKYIHPFLVYLRSSWFSLYFEKNGRLSGGGALQFSAKEYKDSIVPDFNKMSQDNIAKLEKAWQLYKDDIDQDKLDDVVFDVLGFTLNEKKQIIEELKKYIDRRLK